MSEPVTDEHIKQLSVNAELNGQNELASCLFFLSFLFVADRELSATNRKAPWVEQARVALADVLRRAGEELAAPGTHPAETFRRIIEDAETESN